MGVALTNTFAKWAEVKRKTKWDSYRTKTATTMQLLIFFAPHPKSLAAKQEEFPSHPACTTVIGCFALWLPKILRKNGDPG
ncbi:MAG: hypothetical protein NTU79_00665 [Planctomycetota bacterium]|nr:hypothetical protein [Planctomycetota bacterium]